ncbi:hypothetical protein ACT7DB_14880 [Bacillus cereus]
MDPHQKVERVEVLNEQMVQYARKELVAEVNRSTSKSRMYGITQ